MNIESNILRYIDGDQKSGGVKPTERYTSFDVKSLKAILENKYGFKVEILWDASQDQIVDKPEWYRNNLTGRDNFLIYFAGHGKLRKDGGYWIGVDGTKQSRSKWLHYRTISELIDTDNDMKARHVLVIADSCYAGTIIRADEYDIAKRGEKETDQNWFMRMNKTPSRKALTSGGTEPVIDQAGGADHSIFARELIKRLKYNESVLESSELHRMIKKDVDARAKRIVGDDAQAPEYAPIPGTKDLGGDFLFVPRGIDVSIEPSKVASAKGRGEYGIRRDTDFQSNIPTDDSKNGKIVTNHLGMTFVYIPPGTFTMGRPENEMGRQSDERQHQVTLTRGFYMQTTEVTQEQWQAVMGVNFSYFRKCGDNCPVETVSWEDTQPFIAKLNQQEGKFQYRLPTEAEWEYAALAGSTTAFANGEILIAGCGHDPYLDAMGWYCGNSAVSYEGCFNLKEGGGSNCAGPHPVGQKQPNALGLYDMHGNVWEWCSDWYYDFPFYHVTEPSRSNNGSKRVLRCGSWSIGARLCRSANRIGYDPGFRSRDFGFRLVCLPSQPGEPSQ